eukprot:NODE_6082_length_575_cov_9.031250_g5917_i0.p1 GENE.NODE_6082_length_575_cov_9.031250_g5917_i0~~NODE_6082_length_575_cov_9.031250_g5917_i0.p1  ORF type:complete len:175 (+),score=56.13 NODE_6082_length_575_cov_9.031250_g5917_i0:63-527(+)
MNFFFGLQVQPGVKYTQRPPKGSMLRLSQAALGPNVTTRTVVSVGCEGQTLVVCTLQPGRVDQCPLNLCFNDAGDVTFQSEGGVVHLTGFYEAEMLEEQPEVHQHPIEPLFQHTEGKQKKSKKTKRPPPGNTHPTEDKDMQPKKKSKKAKKQKP